MVLDPRNPQSFTPEFSSILGVEVCKKIGDTPCLRLAEVPKYWDAPESNLLFLAEEYSDGCGQIDAPKAAGQFSNAPYFNWNDGKLKFDTNEVSNFNPNYGSVSFRLPDCSDLESVPSGDVFPIRSSGAIRQAYGRFLVGVRKAECIVSRSDNWYRLQVVLEFLQSQV